MKNIRRIFSLYIDIDEQLATGSPGTAEQQILNDQAYFLLCWGQLETEIDDKCRDAVRRRRGDPAWQVRRGWDLYNPDDPRLSGLVFEDRVRLVLDEQAGRGSPYALTLKHYGVRNQIAHGKLQATRISVSAFFRDCTIIQAALHRAA